MSCYQESNRIREHRPTRLREDLPGMCNGLVVALGLLVLTNSCTPLLAKSMETAKAQDNLLTESNPVACATVSRDRKVRRAIWLTVQPPSGSLRDPRAPTANFSSAI